MEQVKFNVVIGRGAKASVEDGIAFLKFILGDGNKIDEETIWEGRKRILWAWEALTDNQKLKEELSKALSFIFALGRYMYWSNKINPLFVKVVEFLVPFDFKGFSGYTLVSRSRFFEERKSVKEFLGVLQKEKNLWNELLFVLKRNIYGTDDEEQALKEFSEFLRKWEDKAFLRQLRADWKKVVKKLIRGAREEFRGAFIRRGEVIGKGTYLKGQNGLRLDIEGFDLPGNRSVYVIFERASEGFFEYELYMVGIEGHTASAYLREKTIVSAEGSGAEVLRKWIEEGWQQQNTWFCFITTEKRESSFLRKLIEDGNFTGLRRRSFFAEYSEVPIVYASERAKGDCLVVYTDDFDTLKSRLRIWEKERRASLAIKLPFSSDLQVFITDGVGWEKTEVYSEMRKTLLLSLFSFSFYNREVSVGKPLSQSLTFNKLQRGKDCLL